MIEQILPSRVARLHIQRREIPCPWSPPFWIALGRDGHLDIGLEMKRRHGDTICMSNVVDHTPAPFSLCPPNFSMFKGLFEHQMFPVVFTDPAAQATRNHVKSVPTSSWHRARSRVSCAALVKTLALPAPIFRTLPLPTLCTSFAAVSLVLAGRGFDAPFLLWILRILLYLSRFFGWLHYSVVGFRLRAGEEPLRRDRRFGLVVGEAGYTVTRPYFCDSTGLRLLRRTCDTRLSCSWS